jgi:transcription antitermination factor NusG
MSSGAIVGTFAQYPFPVQNSVRWYAVQTRARSERAVSWRLTQHGIFTFLPVVTEIHRWSDRKKRIEVPLFGCYIFCKLAGTSEERLVMFRTEGILGIVGARGEGTPIPDEQIETIRALVEHKIACHEHPFLKVGQRVRVHGGAMDGIEGVLQECSDGRRLVVSVEAIQRSLAIRIEGYDVEVL